MRIFSFFRRTCTVPGGSLINPNHRPLYVALVSRVVYHLYPDDFAVVYSGIDYSVSTQALDAKIIARICKIEKLDWRAWSFFSLMTALHNSGLKEGEYGFANVLLKPKVKQIKTEGLLPIACPNIVKDDFADFINCLYDPDDPGFPPFDYYPPPPGEPEDEDQAL